MIFQLFTLLSNNPLLDYSYCALSTDGQGGTRLLLIAEDLISLEVPADETDLEVLYKDYLPTSRKIEYDLDRLEEMIRYYTNKQTFIFHAHFDQSYRIGLAFANLPEWKNWHEYLDPGHEDPTARNIVFEVFTNMEPLLKQVFHAV
jgi:hypothetical protein